MCFLDLDGTGLLPSRFALDNLIVRTFSQPSSKSSYIVTLGLTRDPILNEVLDIEIDIVNETAITAGPDESRKLSTIDIVLICVSILIVFGIVMAACYFNSASPDPQASRAVPDSREKEKTMADMDIEDQVQIDTSHSKESETNESPDISPKVMDSVQSQDKANLGEMMPFEENIVEGSSLESSIDGHSALGIPTAESPDVSYASSSSSTNSKSTMSSASSSSYAEPSEPELLDEEKESESISPHLLGAMEPNYCDSSVSSSGRKNDLAARLMNLSSISGFDLTSRFNPLSSSLSAPPILEERASNWTNSGEAKTDEKSVFSARSASDESWDSSQKVQPRSNSLYRHEKKGSWGGIHVPESFHNNWIESKKKALEDIEEGSLEDVFQIDMERAGVIEEDVGKLTVRSPSVSEWMKSIRVVSSATETQSSVEHSSVEPRSYTKDNSSADLSLEQSLAASIVEPMVEV
ncbi:MAG: hypothetical protein SGILL_005817 [Bacillariaceae sp.]